MFEALFSRTGLSLDRLRALCRVAEAGGIAAAVGRDPTRQSMVSRQLKELEEFFEVELTRREGKGLALTPAGRSLAAVAREQLSALNDFVETSREAVVRFSVGAGDSLLHWRIIPRLGRVQRALPRLALRLQPLGPSALKDLLRDLRLDFGVVSIAADDKQLRSEPLGLLSYALYVPRRLLARRKRHDARRLLGEVPLAIPDGDDRFTGWLQELTAATGIVPRVGVECETFPQAARAVASGGWGAVLPDLARAELGPSDVVEVRSELFADLEVRLHLAWNPRLMRLRTAADAVRRELVAALRF